MKVSASAVTTALLLAPLVASNPTQPRRQAQVVPVKHKRGFTTPEGTFDAAAAKAERNKVVARYGELAKKKRSLQDRKVKAEAIEPFDIQSVKQKRQSSGENSLDDQGDDGA